jgi:hypothetical protein
METDSLTSPEYYEAIRYVKDKLGKCYGTCWKEAWKSEDAKSSITFWTFFLKNPEKFRSLISGN